MIADNILRFGRLMRGAGMPIGPDRVLAAVAAIEHVGVERREDVHAALGAAMLDRHEQQVVFDAAFDAFWRDPQGQQQTISLAPPIRDGKQTPPSPNRLAEALAAQRAPRSASLASSDEPKYGKLTFSERERFRQADFDTMTSAEFALAKKIAEELPLPVQPVRRRRQERSPDGHGGGRLDLRATMQRMARQPQTLTPVFTRARTELPTLVVLLDISGSMDRYARLLLHYVHGLTRRYLKVHTLVFGTQLTQITRSLRHRDPDVALERADLQVRDWKGGTRIASCLADFNRHWGRRLLGANAAVLLMTDGLDRDEHGDLAAAAAQLRRLAHRVVWLNPLLRFDGFEPRAAGVRALLPHVDRFLPVHNLASLADLARVLRHPASRSSPLFPN